LLDSNEVDPAAKIAKYGTIRQELEDPGADVAHDDDDDDAVRGNIFKPYFEEGEEARLTTKESDDDTARFWLLHKYKDIVFVDKDEETPEYRKIVDIEWNIKKPKGWSLRGVAAGSFPWRQWKVVSDLLPEKHQDLIDAATADDEDESPTLEAYFVTSDLFGMIKAVPAELQVRKIELSDDSEMEDGDEEESEEEDPFGL
jgi:hypothetical protein